MKKEDILLGLGTLIVMIGAIMKVMHLSYGSLILSIGLFSLIIIQNWTVKQLKSRIKELEKK